MGKALCGICLASLILDRQRTPQVARPVVWRVPQARYGLLGEEV